jgi:hypothetical protein
MTDLGKVINEIGENRYKFNKFSKRVKVANLRVRQTLDKFSRIGINEH